MFPLMYIFAVLAVLLGLLTMLLIVLTIKMNQLRGEWRDAFEIHQVDVKRKFALANEALQKHDGDIAIIQGRHYSKKPNYQEV